MTSVCPAFSEANSGSFTFSPIFTRGKAAGFGFRLRIKRRVVTPASSRKERATHTAAVFSSRFTDVVASLSLLVEQRTGGDRLPKSGSQARRPDSHGPV